MQKRGSHNPRDHKCSGQPTLYKVAHHQQQRRLNFREIRTSSHHLPGWSKDFIPTIICEASLMMGWRRHRLLNSSPHCRAFQASGKRGGEVLPYWLCWSLCPNSHTVSNLDRGWAQPISQPQPNSTIVTEVAMLDAIRKCYQKSTRSYKWLISPWIQTIWGNKNKNTGARQV